MSEEISNPLLSLIKEQSLIDDLQFEEVQAEFKRSGKSVMQILQDMGSWTWIASCTSWAITLACR